MARLLLMGWRSKEGKVVEGKEEALRDPRSDRLELVREIRSREGLERVRPSEGEVKGWVEVV